MANINPGPAVTATPSATAVLAPAVTPNFGNLYQGVNAYRCIAVGRQIPVSGTGDAAFMPLINTTAFDLNPLAGAIIFANPVTVIGGVVASASISSTIVRLYSGPSTTGLPLLAATTLATLTAGGTAAALIQVATATAGGYYNANTWLAATGIAGTASYGIYFNVSTASGVVASFVDCFVYGTDLT